MFERNFANFAQNVEKKMLAAPDQEARTKVRRSLLSPSTGMLRNPD